MTAAYDSYDYPSYWKGRDYEHLSEVFALKDLLTKIPKVGTALEIGAGFGRLAPAYLFRAKKIILSDPSLKLLRIASKTNKKYKKIKYVHSKVENLNKKLKKESLDLIVMVRVLHHIANVDQVFETISNLLAPGGFLILEFANKRHLKATLKEFGRGNITFPLDIFPKDLSSKKSLKLKSLPFINWHPDIIKHKLTEANLEILETRSVSNFRSSFLKNILPLDTIIHMEKLLQQPLAALNFGPSIFILARKTNG